ncbi:UDP-N-acetylmuramoyl-tripeptide--D-alanyl-D-alanine ligase [Chromohalobacter marismortui]|uniref:UDP-N-acetylmuramoyl-tripeptide--D-alanyl-D-alanine ligase n=1 Tax=Chromohalobacter marismortui TaxID=42055 RepID=A0A4V3F3V8_9GAMM|nr:MULTISPECIES: UDP-N-acetylmuramoyl-tripeptide--D-alanyl-D-alanine ligase [Chromohalobacter]MCI0508527.1 UDP-N-acetylmuramoyl-tripeptide--D-alanyl-D-alanine ligase [Chromohalobacter sp.]MCI0592182.1 UDP-N-acetylmuramoyl-tripeptide--D-alanyl-D-alanine ligase [Chromohalobacter sp.]TDU23006.1 UDP-N-acetylmuramoyl-tripeptide--D-alanyl-D-alanine ligase [Chromohalobacter marismortui]
MSTTTLHEIAGWLGAVAPDVEAVTGQVVSDTRRIAPGDVFLALVGERFDGHDFLEEARDKGAAGAIVSRRVATSLPQIEVADTRLALGMLGRVRRRAWSGELVAVTGNSGKTTVKEMLASILSRSQPTLFTHANLNNDIGVPQTLLALSSAYRRAVVELGANHLGEIAWTTALARPDVAVITNVTGAHVGEFGGLGQIAQAKSEILQGLPSSGTAVLNHDDRFYPLWRELAGEVEVVDFGLDATARVRALALACDDAGRYAFTLSVDGDPLGRVHLALLGRHNVLNALASAAAAWALGVASDDIVAGLEACEAMPGRMACVPGVRGARLLDDTYNANPGAVRAALTVLAGMPAPRWCFLGAMGELGNDSERLHAELGHVARELKIDFLGTFGADARPAVAAFGDSACHFDDWATLVRYAHDHLPSGASVLVKGSRSAGMERLIAELRTDAPR